MAAKAAKAAPEAEDGPSWVPLALTDLDTAYVEVRQFSAVSIARAFGIPAALLRSEPWPF